MTSDPRLPRINSIDFTSSSLRFHYQRYRSYILIHVLDSMDEMTC